MEQNCLIISKHNDIHDLLLIFLRITKETKNSTGQHRSVILKDGTVLQCCNLTAPGSLLPPCARRRFRRFSLYLHGFSPTSQKNIKVDWLQQPHEYHNPHLKIRKSSAAQPKPYSFSYDSLPMTRYKINSESNTDQINEV